MEVYEAHYDKYIALKDLQKSKPLYAASPSLSASLSVSSSASSSSPSQNPKSDPTSWWAEIIRRTALGANASPSLVTRHLPDIVPKLMKRFSSDEGYMLFGDVIPACPCLILVILSYTEAFFLGHWLVDRRMY